MMPLGKHKIFTDESAKKAKTWPQENGFVSKKT